MLISKFLEEDIEDIKAHLKENVFDWKGKPSKNTVMVL